MRLLMPARHSRSRSPHVFPSQRIFHLAAVSCVVIMVGAHSAFASAARPNVLVISVDTLRSDRLSSYGYGRPTTPAIDSLLRSGVRFANARTVEPLTGPAMASMLTSRYPHDHGMTRNALKIRPGLSSVSKLLRRNGYITTAFVSNWTLARDVSGLHEHFHLYEEVLTRKRWLGMFKEEAEAEDVTEAVVTWLGDQKSGDQPWFAWAHYTDPHAPYLFRSEFADQLGLPRSASRHSQSDRYDTEIAATDAAIGRLLEFVKRRIDDETLIIFTADHGENFGEHGAWGHGRHLWEDAVRIPFGITWKGRVKPRVIAEAARIIDIAPTILGLLDIEAPSVFMGHDWSDVLTAGAPAPQLITFMQAHRGAVLPGRNPDGAREKGLLEVAVIEGNVKTFWIPRSRRVLAFNLATDPREMLDIGASASEASTVLDSWMADVSQKLRRQAELPAALDSEAIEKLRALGYLQ